MADKRISQLIERVDIANNDVLPIVASGATTTNKVTISTIQDWMQENLDVGVTSVGITLGSSGTDVNVTGSPITTSGNITINIPTASATNRGLLSAADWSTFNGKQNSITLTTSGTSGAATLVGSTLNIPNYSTGVANAYVPYVGAIGSVSLGYNALSASQINIDGASPTGGSYLGFKHSTSVNTGTDGYTSMYTFGTNTIGFQSTSGGTSKAFAFSMLGITAGVPGGRQYTLPDASGTLALTSDLSGYVTLGTAQTITAQKTFTTSGGDDTLIVNHTSGSGIAVDISKAGNGEGLRVAKTSGTGNAVTITGGLLSAEAATFSGALNGTSASFTGGITSTGTGLNPSLRLTNTTASTGTDWHLYSLNNGNFGIYNNTAGAYSLQIASTGAATFSGALTTSGDFFISGASKSIVFNSGTNLNTQIYETSGSLVLYTGGNPRLTLASTGAATFSSSVNIASTTTIGGVDGSFLRTYSATNDALRWAFINSSTGIFSIQQQGDGYANQGDRLVINRSGNVGIGTASPSQRLHVANSSGTVVAYLQSTATNGEATLALEGKNSSGTTRNGIFKYDNADLFRIGTSSPIDFRFETNDTERMRITSGGNVGIGTNSPIDKLNVSGGGITLTGTLSSPTNTTIGSLQIGYDGTNGIIRTWSSSPLIFSNYNYQSFETNGTERMRITGSGNVGIGTASPDTFSYGGNRNFLTLRSTATNQEPFLQLIANGVGNSLIDFGNESIRRATIIGENGSNLVFYTNGSNSGTGVTERMQITSGGFTKARANGGSYFNGSYHEFVNNNNVSGDRCLVIGNKQGSNTNNTSSITFTVADADNDRLYIYGNGNVVNQNNSYGSLSDIKLKENIEDATPKLDDLMKVKVRNYNLIGDDKKQIGVIAQELEEVFPAMIDESEDFEDIEVPQVDEEGNEILNEEGEVVTEKQRISKGTTTKSVKYSVFVPMLIKAMQEQQEQIKSLTEQVEALKSQING